MDIITRVFSTTSTITVKFGPLNSVENVNPLMLQDYTVSVQDALTSGVRFDNVNLNNQYYVLLIPTEEKIVVDKVFQGGYKISTRAKTFVDNNRKEWHMYYPSVPTTGSYTFMYKIMREE